MSYIAEFYDAMRATQIVKRGDTSYLRIGDDNTDPPTLYVRNLASGVLLAVTPKSMAAVWPKVCR